MEKSFKLMCFHVITAIFVIIFALSLHIIDNAYSYSIESGRGGIMEDAVVGVFSTKESSS